MWGRRRAEKKTPPWRASEGLPPPYVRKWVSEEIQALCLGLQNTIPCKVGVTGAPERWASAGWSASIHPLRLDGSCRRHTYEIEIAHVIMNTSMAACREGAVFYTLAVNRNTLLLPILPLSSAKTSHLLRLTVFGYVTVITSVCNGPETLFQNNCHPLANIGHIGVFAFKWFWKIYNYMHILRETLIFWVVESWGRVYKGNHFLSAIQTDGKQ